MSDWNDENDGPREDAPNPTQQAIDEGGASDQPADASWSEESWGETESAPHEGEEGEVGEPG